MKMVVHVDEGARHPFGFDFSRCPGTVPANMGRPNQKSPGNCVGAIFGMVKT